MSTEVAVAVDAIASRIVVVRGLRAILDADLAALYGVETRRLNEQVRRNAAKFPPDFLHIHRTPLVHGGELAAIVIYLAVLHRAAPALIYQFF